MRANNRVFQNYSIVITSRRDLETARTDRAVELDLRANVLISIAIVAVDIHGAAGCAQSYSQFQRNVVTAIKGDTTSSTGRGKVCVDRKIVALSFRISRGQSNIAAACICDRLIDGQRAQRGDGDVSAGHRNTVECAGHTTDEDAARQIRQREAAGAAETFECCDCHLDWVRAGANARCGGKHQIGCDDVIRRGAIVVRDSAAGCREKEIARPDVQRVDRNATRRVSEERAAALREKRESAAVDVELTCLAGADGAGFAGDFEIDVCRHDVGDVVAEAD